MSKLPSPTERDEIIAGFQSLVEYYGLSLDKPEDIWKLAIALYMDFARPALRAPRVGVQADPRDIVDDAILAFGVYQADREGPPVKGRLRAVLRDLAQANGWRTDPASLETLRRRYYQLIKPGTPEHRNMAKLTRDILPTVQAHFAGKGRVRH